MNLFTLVRHRRMDSLDPWHNSPGKQWRTDPLTECISLLTFDAQLSDCQEHIDRILNSGELQADALQIDYALESTPRRHWAYRDQHRTPDEVLLSPFRRYSAEILELWNFDAELTLLWRENLAPSLEQTRERLDHLGFPLLYRSDRVGNFIIANAQDAITCCLAGPKDLKLKLTFVGDDLKPRAYVGTVWARHSGDEILNQQVPVTLGETEEIALDSDVDAVGCAVHRVSDGVCVDLVAHNLIMETPIHGFMKTGPSLTLKKKGSGKGHTINPSVTRLDQNILPDRYSPALDRSIRQQHKQYLRIRQEQRSRNRGKTFRFEAEEHEQAYRHFCRILSEDRDPKSPIYFSDPYLHLAEDEQLWLAMLDVTVDAPLRALCCGETHEDYKAWWAALPKRLSSHITVRIFKAAHKRDRAFHDRFLITPKREVLISNSVNGWQKHGATFATLSHSVYAENTERLWSLGVGAESGQYEIEELK